MRIVPTLALATLASAPASRSARADPVEQKTALYVEALGTGGLWGVGGDYRIHPRWAIGAVGSGGSSEDQSYFSITPYGTLDITRSMSGRHAWLLDGGAQLAHVWNDSPVPEWTGTSSTGVGGIVSTGYEYRNRVLLRFLLQGAFGKGGFVPWLGADIGMTL